MGRFCLVKVGFDVSHQPNAEIAIERLWAIPLKSGIFKIDNSPFTAYGVSLGDEVFAKKIGGELMFSGISERSGHSTYRIKLPHGKDHDYFLKYWEPLERLGCTYEGASGYRRLYSIDLPNPDYIKDTFHILQEREKEGVWEFEEAHRFELGT